MTNISSAQKGLWQNINDDPTDDEIGAEDDKMQAILILRNTDEKRY